MNQAVLAAKKLKMTKLLIISLYFLCPLWLYLLILAYLSSRSVKISVNPWLIKVLRENKALYNCRETFTDVMSALQIHLFMQNKANFQKVKLNVTKVLTRDYDQMDTWSIRKTKPIQTQLKPIQSQLKPIQSQFKPNTNPIKTKQTQFQSQYNAEFED